MNNRSNALLLTLSLCTIPFSSALAQAKDQLSSKQLVTPSPIIEQHKIDLNKASVAELSGSFKGIGKKRAEAIIAYREAHQGFKSVEELAEVKGLGVHFVEKNKEQLAQLYSVQ